MQRNIDHEHDVKFSQLDKIKKHFEENKNVYFGVLGGVGIGAAGILVLRNSSTPMQITNTVAPIFNNDNSSVVNFGGAMSKIVMRVSDEKVWQKATLAAKEAGKPLHVMSKHLNEYPGYETIDGEIYKIIGVATTG